MKPLVSELWGFAFNCWQKLYLVMGSGQNLGGRQPRRKRPYRVAAFTADSIIKRVMLPVSVAAASGMRIARMSTGTGIAWLADVPYCLRHDGPPELVIRRKHLVVAMPVLARRRDKVRQTIEELKCRKQFHTSNPTARRVRHSPMFRDHGYVGSIAQVATLVQGGFR